MTEETRAEKYEAPALRELGSVSDYTQLDDGGPSSQDTGSQP